MPLPLIARVIATLLFVAVMPLCCALAAEFKIREAPYSIHLNIKVIELNGDIVAGDVGRLTSLFGANFKCDDYTTDCTPHSALAALDSGGGDYQEGQKLARFFREHAIATIVESGRRCLSACAVAYLGGSGYWPTGGIGAFVARYIEPGARIGFHAPYLRPDDAQEIAKSNLPLVLQTARLDNEQLANIINTYFVDPYVIGNILVKGPDETYDIDTIEDMVKFRVNFPYFPPALVPISLPEKVRNICLKLLSIRNAEPISQFEGDYLEKSFGASSVKTRDGQQVFGYAINDRPLNIDFCGFSGPDGDDRLADGSVQLFRLGHSEDGSQNYEDPFYNFDYKIEAWSSAGYDQQEGSRSILSLDGPLNSWLYDRKARIADIAANFNDYLRLQKVPIAAAWGELQSKYLSDHGGKPTDGYDNRRGYFFDGLDVQVSIWPREMFGYLLREAFSARNGFVVTYSQKFSDAYVVTGPDTQETADICILGLRDGNGAALVRIKALWPEGATTTTDPARKAITAIACTTQFGSTKLPCNH